MLFDLWGQRDGHLRRAANSAHNTVMQFCQSYSDSDTEGSGSKCDINESEELENDFSIIFNKRMLNQVSPKEHTNSSK